MLHKLLNQIINHKNIFAVLLLIAAFAASMGYIWIPQENNSQLGPDKYIFLEHYVETKAQVIGNDDPADQSAYDYLGYQAYNYSNLSSQVQPSDYFPDINRSLKVFFTDGSSVGLAGCHGQSTNVSGIYSLPYDANGIRILSVNNSGTAFIERSGKRIILRPEDKLVNFTSTIVNVQFTNSTVNKSLRINVTVMDRLKNFGICHKKNV
ncbi:MAG: hypothetical protein ACE14P_05875 [Methanotrichaceae archaeon]